MEETIKEIAERIKGLREIVGITAAEMAKELKISVELYQDYENGNADIPASILYILAQHFHVELTALLTGEEPRLHSYALTRKGNGVSVERRKDYKYQNLALNFIHKKAEPFLVTVDPESGDVPVRLNNHPGQEFDYVLEGTLKIVLGKNEVILNEGDSLFYDSNIDHGMKALDGRTAKFLAIIL
ncbi:MAG TPA: transcriptional regulator [Firmicutes bacterium]|jgi:transcriptional regulator with XRE-family HTH domain|nr:transcriptional regulator [Bacillota bacterium]